MHRKDYVKLRMHTCEVKTYGTERNMKTLCEHFYFKLQEIL